MSLASQPSYSLQIPPNNHSTTGTDINIDINKSDTAESTSRAGRACILSLHWANRDSILKSRDVTLPTKVRLVKAMVVPVVMYGCESWTVKKAERRRIVAFEQWSWRRLLRVPGTATRSNQFILKEINPGISLEGMMLKLNLQYLGHLT